LDPWQALLVGSCGDSLDSSPVVLKQIMKSSSNRITVSQRHFAKSSDITLAILLDHVMVTVYCIMLVYYFIYLERKIFMGVHRDVNTMPHFLTEEMKAA
jgi:hypothetical protein